MNDIFGRAILDFQLNNNPQNLITETSISEPDEMSVAYLFRDFNQMPLLEQKALELANGHVLDIGCGAGSHSLYLQNQRSLRVSAIDISPSAVAACKLRGLSDVHVVDLMEAQGKYDTLLLLMNGTGLCGKLSNINEFLQKLKSLLAPGGQILIDSSDIIYMFDQDDDGGKWVPSNDYYGELVFDVTYKGETDSFPWLYVDINTLTNAASANGLHCELVTEGEHYDYLARLTSW